MTPVARTALYVFAGFVALLLLGWELRVCSWMSHADAHTVRRCPLAASVVVQPSTPGGPKPLNRFPPFSLLAHEKLTIANGLRRRVKDIYTFVYNWCHDCDRASPPPPSPRPVAGGARGCGRRPGEHDRQMGARGDADAAGDGPAGPPCGRRCGAPGWREPTRTLLNRGIDGYQQLRPVGRTLLNVSSVRAGRISTRQSRKAGVRLAVPRRAKRELDSFQLSRTPHA